MGCFDLFLCLFLPPLASGVRARGCGAMIFVLILTIIGWLPGAIAAFLLTIDYNDKRSRGLL
jgi:uncharacterized membrane protein YqaE (UPF0057 family)